MHKRIIWTLFFAAFILDVIRLQSEKSTKKPTQKKINEDQPNKEPIKEKENENIIKEEDSEDLENNEELKVIDNFAKKKKNKNINLRIEFCQSWSHRGYFNQVKQYLESNYTNIVVEPSDYPLSSQRKILLYLVTFVQFGGVALAFAGKNIQPYVKGIIPNDFFDWIEGNKLMFGMACFLTGNMLNNYINNAGAFEIYCNEKLIWSAINNNKKVPNIERIILLANKYGGKLLRRY